MELPAKQAWYALKDVPDKGKGLVATRNIPRGTRILSETPVFTMPTGKTMEERQNLICQQMDSLSNDQRNAFLSMHNAHLFNDAAEQYIGIFRTNCLPADEFPDKAGIFLEACRINHDCDNNAIHNWNEKIKRHTVHAIRDIEEGEEITLSYVSLLENRETRQSKLEEKFDFTCSCRVCSLPEEQSQEHDRKLEQIVRTNELLKICMLQSVMSPLMILGYLYNQAHRYTEIGREDCGYAQTLEEALTILIAHGDLARGRLLAQKVASLWKILVGNDSSQTDEYAALARDPSSYRLYGVSGKLKTAVEEVPQGLEPDDFEDWLWRRPKLESLVQPMSSSSQLNFSGFIDLPYKNGIDTSVSSGSSEARHSCFLGEIVTMPCRDPLDLEIKDIHNKKTTIHFYTKDQGREFGAIGFQAGYTVAVLDASRYDFKFGPPGIRHEDPRMIKTFPLSLDKILVLNDQVRRFSTRRDNNTRTCHGCGTIAPEASMKSCSMCLSFWYCNKKCQRAGWTTKAHKDECKFLRDPDLRGLFLIKWDEVQDCVCFPLKARKHWV
ncbi:hypothetical protein E4U09_003024 [Claviceps aff. purpurea]|uniref:Suppressor of anucleate metulae protein B n=1 Tax=Claviceps aff. purpurea TaxID=1967640 RepID=A0A9P7U1A3_9HYPO|nr:hypothetical protein E4U09_003024 [Claviceps aff. purpurea]